MGDTTFIFQLTHLSPPIIEMHQKREKSISISNHSDLYINLDFCSESILVYHVVITNLTSIFNLIN